MDTMTADTLGQRLRSARMSKGYQSQGDFAKLINVSRASLNAWENDRGLPSAKTCIKIAKVLQIDLTWLLTGAPVKKT